MKLYVGNIDRTATEDDLKELFQTHGAIASLTIIKDRYTNESRGFGFVEFSDSEEAKKAMKAVDGHMLKGRSLKVNEAQEREERPRSSGGGFGGGPRSGGYGSRDDQPRSGGFGSRDDSRGGGRRDFGGDRQGGGRSRFGA